MRWAQLLLSPKLTYGNENDARSAYEYRDGWRPLDSKNHVGEAKAAKRSRSPLPVDRTHHAGHVM